MPNDELRMLWRQVEALHEAVAELISLQSDTLLAQGANAQSAAPTRAVAERLGQLQAGLEAQRQEARSRVAAEDETQLHLGEIDVERINIVESDGTLRLVISNTESAPDPIVDGRAMKRQEGNTAGMIFYNDEGDECGGLVYSGHRQGDRYEAGGALLFDQFKQDQAVGIMYADENGRRRAGLSVWDRPDVPLAELVDQYVALDQMPAGPDKDQAIETMRAAGAFGASRIFIGKTVDHEAALLLHDAQGRVRLRLVVTADGSAGLEFLDEDGRVTHEPSGSTGTREG